MLQQILLEFILRVRNSLRFNPFVNHQSFFLIVKKSSKSFVAKNKSERKKQKNPRDIKLSHNIFKSLKSLQKLKLNKILIEKRRKFVLQIIKNLSKF